MSKSRDPFGFPSSPPEKGTLKNFARISSPLFSTNQANKRIQYIYIYIYIYIYMYTFVNIYYIYIYTLLFAGLLIPAKKAPTNSSISVDASAEELRPRRQHQPGGLQDVPLRLQGAKP